MSNAAIGAWLVVWLSLVGVGIALLVLRQPRRRKPVDELEAADAALRARVIDLEDKYESAAKRYAVREMRARRELDQDQGVLPLDKVSRLALVRARAAAAGLTRRA
jgi:hypothetical protein